MEHRLFVTSEAGYIYNVVDGEYSIFYDIEDETEYFGKIARYNNNLLVVGGYKNINILVADDGQNYCVYRTNLGELGHSDAIKFIDDFLVVASSSHNTIIFIPVEEIYNNLLINSICKCFVAQLRPFLAFKLNNVDFIDNQFLLGLKVLDKKTLDSGLLYAEKDFSAYFIKQYGWKATKLAVIDGKIYTICNNVYGTEKKPCLVVNEKKVVVFHESYELNDFSVSDDYIYIVGRCITEIDGTTANRGIIIILDRKYNLIDTYFIKGSGALLGCLSVDKDYANDAVVYHCTDFVKAQLKENIMYKSLYIMKGYEE